MAFTALKTGIATLRHPYNNDYINKEYRIIDAINILKYNKDTGIHRVLKNADKGPENMITNELREALRVYIAENYAEIEDKCAEYEIDLKEILGLEKEIIKLEKSTLASDKNKLIIKKRLLEKLKAEPNKQRKYHASNYK